MERVVLLRRAARAIPVAATTNEGSPQAVVLLATPPGRLSGVRPPDRRL